MKKQQSMDWRQLQFKPIDQNSLQTLKGGGSGGSGGLTIVRSWNTPDDPDRTVEMD